jgi:hypothetical protein
MTQITDYQMNIPPEKFMTEAVIQATFFYYCQLHSVNCSLEISSPVGRHDAIVFNEDWTRALAIVECKSKEGRGKSQQSRYAQTGVPVFMLFHVNDAKELVLKISRSTFTGVSWVAISQLPKKQRRRKNRFSPMNLCEEINLRE